MQRICWVLLALAMGISWAEAKSVKEPKAITRMLADIAKVGGFIKSDLKAQSVECLNVGVGITCLASFGSGVILNIAMKDGDIVLKQWVVSRETSATADQAKGIVAFMISNNVVPDEWTRVTSLGAECLKSEKAEAQTHAVKSTNGSRVLSFEPTGTGCVAQNED